MQKTGERLGGNSRLTVGGLYRHSVCGTNSKSQLQKTNNTFPLNLLSAQWSDCEKDRENVLEETRNLQGLLCETTLLYRTTSSLFISSGRSLVYSWKNRAWRSLENISSNHARPEHNAIQPAPDSDHACDAKWISNNAIVRRETTTPQWKYHQRQTKERTQRSFSAFFSDRKFLSMATMLAVWCAAGAIWKA